MATTIKSTSLDFDAIKNNLKTFLAEKDEFADYNFEASGLSISWTYLRTIPTTMV